MAKLTPPELAAHTPLVMVTAYDYPGARQAELAGVDLILVGDSLGNTVLGYDSTALVTLADMLHHTRAARRGAPDTLLVADMPFGSTQQGLRHAQAAAVALLQQGGADAVKIEGHSPEVLQIVGALTRSGVPVMGHVGLLPQTAAAQGGLRVQGKDEAGAQAALAGARDLESAGAFAVVLEAIPARLAARITEELTVPTIGIGAGLRCGGQVLVYHDLLGVTPEPKKLARRYAELHELSVSALRQYAAEVRAGEFPGKEHSFVISDEVLGKLY